jgi:hypothetical protein
MAKIRKPNSGDTTCHCGEDAVNVVCGEENCYYCGNEIPLCEDCFNLLKLDINNYDNNK